MLKKRDLHEVPVLFELSSHPDVYRYIRHKTDSSDEFYFLTKQLMEAEQNGELISRTILDEYEQPIGTINLYDIHNHAGFLATWVGQPFFGKGYNKPAKEAFFEELFFQLGIETIFMKIRKTNFRSLKAIIKLNYVTHGNALYPEVYAEINRNEDVYELFAISKEHYETYLQFARVQIGAEEEVVS